MTHESNNSGPESCQVGKVGAQRFAGRALILAIILLAVPMVGAQTATAQTERVIYSFGSYPDGEAPLAGLAQDAKGSFYGTTGYGGANGDGTVFKVTPGGKEKVLFSFTRVPDGATPLAGLTIDANGNFYGTTSLGGENNGCGTVFKITPGGKHKVLYTFACGTDGISPVAGVTLDAQGNLYGTTQQGGANGDGTVFKLTAGGKEKWLYSFTGGMDGRMPMSGLIQDAKGNLYGTTEQGGAGLWGTVFKVTPGGKLTALYSFTNNADGGEPTAGLVRDAKGNLYGTTSTGGNGNCAFGCGTVFEVTPAGAESVIYSFTGGADGALPTHGLVRDANGNLYGTTYGGGASGWGTVFKVTPQGAHKVLYSFPGGADGGDPTCDLIEDTKGNFYGTAQSGGDSTSGVVFKLTR